MSAIRKADPIAVTHRQWRPHYESRPYQQHPGRRLHVHGAIQPMESKVDRTAPMFAWVALIVAAYFIGRSILG